jgi:hypothetical protein
MLRTRELPLVIYDIHRTNKKKTNKQKQNTAQHTKHSKDELHRHHKKIPFMRSSYNFYGLDSCKVKHLCVSNLGVCVSFHIMTGAFLLHPRWISYMTSGSVFCCVLFLFVCFFFVCFRSLPFAQCCQFLWIGWSNHHWTIGFPQRLFRDNVSVSILPIDIN